MWVSSHLSATQEELPRDEAPQRTAAEAMTPAPSPASVARAIYAEWCKEPSTWPEDEIASLVKAALDAARRDGAREALEAAAKIADQFTKTMTPPIAVGTGRMWRSGQAVAIAKAIRTAALETEAPR